MANLGPLYQNQTYSNLLQVDGGLTAELKPVLDGDGNASGLTLSLTGVGISGLVADSATNIYGGSAGAIPFQTSANITSFVPAGASGYVLASNAGAEPYWTNVIQNATFATLSNDLAGGSAGSVPYQVGGNDTSFTAVGSAGQVLVSGGSAAPYWSNSVPSALSANIANDVAGGSAGNLLYQVTANNTDYITNGTAGQLLKSQGASTPIWSTITASEVGAVPLSGGSASPMTGDLWMGFNKIQAVGSPVSATDAANKSYVDSVASGLKVKAACRVATTANISLTGAATIDGVAVNNLDRVLVKNQTDQTANGIYDANTGGAWTRSTDADTWTEIVGATTFITAGSSNINTTWTCNAASSGTIGVTAITFVIFGASTSYTAGTGLTLTGSQFSLNTPVTVANGGSGATALTGILKGNGTSAFSVATASDVVSLIGSTAVANATTAASCSGNAATATALQTGRTINGVSFNGTANITVAANTNFGCTFAAGGTGDASGTSFNGSAARNISYNTIGAASADGTNATGSWPINVSGTSSNVSGIVAVANGGTAANNAASARSNLGAAASGANTDITSVFLNNTGLKVKSINPSYGLTFAPGSALTADRTFNVVTGDASRTLDISAASVTISSAGASFLAQADAANQRSALGLGTISTQNSNNVGITGGNISGNIGTAASFLNFQSNALYIGSDGRVGFGMNNPSTKVAIQSTGVNPLDLYRTDGNYVVQLRGASTAIPGAIAMSGDVMQLWASNAARLLIDSSGITAQGTLNTTNAAGSRSNLGATTIGGSMFTLPNPSAVRFPRFNADNTVSALDAADFRTAIGVGTGSGTVLSVGMTVPTGLVVSGSPITSIGTLAVSYAAGYAIPTTLSQTNWDTAYSERRQWDGGSTGLVAATGRSSLGATTIGSSVFTLADQNAIKFLQINANNTVSALDAATFRSAIGAGTSSTTGTVTSVSMTVPTGLAVSGSPVTSSGTLGLSYAAGYAIPTTASQSNWDTAYSQRFQWDGGGTNLVPATGRASLGLGSLATQAANSVAITGGTINGTSLGATTAASAVVTSLTASGAVNFSDYITVDPLVSAYFKTPRIWDDSATHWYRITPSELSLNVYTTLPALTGNDTFVFQDHTQTLTNKTLTSPTISGGTITGITDLAIADGGTGASTASAARSNLGIGTVATINTTGSTTNFLRADGTWQTPAAASGGWTVSGSTSYTSNNVLLTDVSPVALLTSGDLQYCNVQITKGGQNTTGGGIGAIQSSNDNSCSLFGFFKTRSTTPAGFTALISGDDTGELGYHGTDGAQYVKGAIITAVMDGNAAISGSNSSMPMKLTFWTRNATYDSPSPYNNALKEALRIDKDQNVLVTGLTNTANTGGKFAIGLSVSPTYEYTHVSKTSGIAAATYYTGSTGGGSVINTNNGFTSTTPIYGFWYDENTGLGNPGASTVNIVCNSVEQVRFFNNTRTSFGTSTAPTYLTYAVKNYYGTNVWEFGPDANDFYVTQNSGSYLGVKLTWGATSWTTASDETIKTDLLPIENGLNKVNALRAVTGKFMNDDTNAVRPFLIAQDLIQVLPEAVDNSEGQPMGIRYTEVIPLLVAAIKELSAKIDALEAANNG